MIPFDLFSRFECGDMTALFFKKDNALAFTIIPAGMEAQIPEHPSDISQTCACRGICTANKSKMSSVTLENMVQFHIQGDAFSGYTTSETMVNNCTSRRLEFVSQDQRGDVIRTVFRDPLHDIVATHTITYRAGEKLFEVNTTLENAGKETLVIDMLDSFQLGMLSPFASDDGPARYHLHRTGAYWASEGRQIDDSLEHLNMERAWTPGVFRGERFGQRSSMPVKRWFPWAGFEDRIAGVTWGVQLATYGPWQLEINRLGDYINLAGGLPDCEFGNWSRNFAPGEKIIGIPALLTVVKGDAQDALNRLIQWPQQHHLTAYSRNEADFPAIFNEYCKTWAAPTEEKMFKLAEVLKGRGIKYFVMDDGWYREDGAQFNGKGDWQTAPSRFPHGMKYYCDKLRAMGFIPGIWFEFEQVSAEHSHLSVDHPELLLRFHGIPHADCWKTNVLDFRKREVRDLMHQRVTDFLRDNGIGYIKVDYNYAVVGADTANGSSMQGIMEYLDGVVQFFVEMKQRVPDLTLEVCASGGHRLTPAWMQIGDMASFSDAHEDPIIPLVAAGTALQIPYRANQVWAVLHPWDDDARICYSLSAAMIGRLCISGDVDMLSDAQNKRIDEALAFYHQLKSLIAEGVCRTELHLKDESWRHARGWQLFRRSNASAQLLVIHAFDDCEQEISITVPADMHIVATFSDNTAKILLHDGVLTISNLHAMTGIALLLQ